MRGIVNVHVLVAVLAAGVSAKLAGQQQGAAPTATVSVPPVFALQQPPNLAIRSRTERLVGCGGSVDHFGEC